MGKANYELNWVGPYGFWSVDDCKSVFESEVIHSPGLYLWTVKIRDSYQVNYVGTTARTLGERFIEHVFSFLKGDYTFYDPDEFSQGHKNRVYGGQSMPAIDFLAKYLEPSSSLFKMFSLLRFFLVPLEENGRILKRIEGAIIKKIKSANDKIADFIDNEIETSRRQDEEEISVLMKFPCQILGLPENERLVA